MSRQDLSADLSPVLNIIGQGIIMMFLEFLWGVLLYIIIILFPFRVGHGFTKSGHTFTPFLEKNCRDIPTKRTLNQGLNHRNRAFLGVTGGNHYFLTRKFYHTYKKLSMI